MQDHKDYSAYLYILPASLVILLFHVFPVIYSFLLSIFRGTLKNPMRYFIGLENYVELFQDIEFWRAMLNTAFFSVMSVPLGILIALGIAILLNQKIKGLGIYRTIYYLPVITSIAAVALVWKWLFDTKSGFFNQLFEMVGISPSLWLSESRGIFQVVLGWLSIDLPQYIQVCGGDFDQVITRLIHGPSVALCCIIVMSVWKVLGYNVVIFLAGLQNIPAQLYEAAEIDGASPFQQFKNVTWPLLSPTTFFIFIMSTISSFQVFVQVFMMTPFGGPDRSTSVVVFYLYEKAFKTFEFGYAAAMAYVLFTIIFVLTLLQKKYVGEKVHYGG